MMVVLFDGRTGGVRKRDVPVPLREELVLTTWTAANADSRRAPPSARHEVYRQVGPRQYEFFGTAPDDAGHPVDQTIPWRPDAA